MNLKRTVTSIGIITMFIGLAITPMSGANNIEKEGDYIGLISVGDVIKASLIEKDLELKNLNAIMSWEYYENWRWRKKK